MPFISIIPPSTDDEVRSSVRQSPLSTRTPSLALTSCTCSHGHATHAHSATATHASATAAKAAKATATKATLLLHGLLAVHWLAVSTAAAHHSWLSIATGHHGLLSVATTAHHRSLLSPLCTLVVGRWARGRGEVGRVGLVAATLFTTWVHPDGTGRRRTSVDIEVPVVAERWPGEQGPNLPLRHLVVLTCCPTA